MASDDSKLAFLDPAADPALNEDSALTLLKQTDLAPEILEQLSKQSALLKSRKVKLAIVCHARTPRHVSLAIVRQMFTFDLMRVTLAPVIPGDVKVAAEEALMRRLETMSEGERLALARRASGRVAGALLSDAQERVIRAALSNPRLTEALIIRALNHGATPILVEIACRDPKWSLRREVRIALVQSQHTPFSCALEFARNLPAPLRKDLLQNGRVPDKVKELLAEVGSENAGNKS